MISSKRSVEEDPLEVEASWISDVAKAASEAPASSNAPAHTNPDDLITLKAAWKSMVAGDKHRARLILQDVVHHNPDNYRAWLWLAGLTPSARGSLAYIAEAEALNPGDPNIAKARQWAETRLREDAQPALAQAGVLGFRWRDVLWTTIGGLGLLALATLGDELQLLSPVRLLLGFLFVLYVPGYWLVAALFPRSNDLDAIERLGISLGLSVALIPVLALILSWLPAGLQLGPVLYGELLMITILMLIAVWRRSQLPAQEAFMPVKHNRPVEWWRTRSRPDRQVYVLLSGLFVLVLIAVTVVFVLPDPDQYMTEFYILGPEGLAQDYPHTLTLGDSATLQFGIMNEERSPETYRVQVTSADQVLASAGPFDLSAGESVQSPITFTPLTSGEEVGVQILLTRDGDPVPYRTLELWMMIEPAQ